MELTIVKEKFLDPVSRLAAIANAKSYNLNTYNILIQANAGIATMVACNPEVVLILNCPAIMDSNFEISVNAKKFLDIIRVMPDGNIVITKGEGEQIVIKGEKGKPNFKVGGSNPQEFPFEFDGEINKIVLEEINKESLSRIISKTSWSVMQNESQYGLNSCLLDQTKEEGNIQAVSSNGVCLTTLISKFPAIKSRTLIPANGLLEANSFLKVCDEKILFGINEKMCILKNKDDMLKINLASAEFPDYKKVLSQLGDEKEMVVDKTRIEEALFRASVMCDPSNPTVKISFSKGVAQFSSSQNTSISGAAEDEMPTTYDGEDMEISFDIKNLLTAISMVDEDNVTIGIKNSKSPIFICGEKNDDYFCMIVPFG